MISQTASAELQRQAQISLARRSFWHYCLYTDSVQYETPHLKQLCTILNNVFYGLPLDHTGKVYRKIVLSLPPRHWKTRTLIHFCAWALGKNQQHRIIAGTYNEKEASDYGKFTRDEIVEEKNDPADIVFSDVFKDDGKAVSLKHGDMGKSKWALEGEHFNFLATSPHGSLTGKGGTIKILDDLVKDAEKAMNENHLDSLFTWCVSTWASRTEGMDGGNPIEILCATRWSKNDPTGRFMQEEPGEWYEFSLEVYDGKNMLCDDMLTYEAYARNRRLAERNTNPVSRAIFQANYHQKIVAIEGCLYTNIQTYDELPQSYEARKAYIDVADEGDDFLCAGMYIESGGLAYMVDVYYTQESAEVTEPVLAQKLIDADIRDIVSESNGGARSYSRNVEREVGERGGDAKFITFHQRKNKMARIQSQSNNVLDKVRMPENWIHLWPEFANHVLSFNTKIKNQADDAPDMLTGIYERMGRKLSWG
jgi:predicted phage terminase large subunit-like protein